MTSTSSEDHRRRARGSGLSGLPQQQDKPGPKAVAAKRRKSRDENAGGPGGLGYVNGLDEREQSKIDWHGVEGGAKAPPRRR